MRRFCTFLVATAVLGGGALASPGTSAATAGQAVHQGVRSTACRPAQHPFTPMAVSIPHVVGRSTVLALGRDRRGVPRPPPLTDRGKWQFAWDKDSKIRPGSAHGVVRMNAHTYPRFAGSALGNRLLERLRVRASIVVTGADDQRLCYRVTRRVSVRAEASLSSYYASSGPPRLAILVCSGTRRGPGVWSHRTIWFAMPKPIAGS